jgi:hypothetical protein
LFKFILISLFIASTFYQSSAIAYSPIIRSFHSVRAAGMGDVRYTTGLFEENLYANPARQTQNPENLLILPDVSVEMGTNTFSNLNSLIKAKDLSAFSGDVGKPLSASAQIMIPAFFKREFWNHNWSFGAGVLVRAQTVAEVSESGEIDPTAIVNAGPAVTLARRLLDDHLSVGATGHVEYRASSNSTYSLLKYLQNQQGIPDTLRSGGGSGLGYDFDLGASFRPRWRTLGFEYEFGGAVNNVMGGKYTQFGHKISDLQNDPYATPRSYNGGLAITSHQFFFFTSCIFSGEVTDIGNNGGGNGSFYRLLHLGTELKWHLLSVRGGVNQGYLTAGVGLNLLILDINFATYGEELGLNAGSIQDRRYALEVGIKI